MRYYVAEYRLTKITGRQGADEFLTRVYAVTARTSQEALDRVRAEVGATVARRKKYLITTAVHPSTPVTNLDA